MNNNYCYVSQELFKTLKNSNLLNKAERVLEERKSSYGDDHVKNLTDIASIASVLTKKELNAEDVCNVLIALKLVRESASHKEDNLIDLISYITFLNDLKK